MRFSIDISLFTSEDGAFGNVTGTIELSIAPTIGDKISFLFPRKGVAPYIGSGFSGLLAITDRVLSANKADDVALALSDLVVSTRADAVSVSRYLEEGFGLFLSEYPKTQKSN